MAILKNKIDNSGIDPTYYSRVSNAESRNNPNAKNTQSSASGTFQFIDSTWKGLTQKYNLPYTLNDRFDPEKSREVAELYTKENAAYLKNKTGITPNNTDLYAAHFMGSYGASKLVAQARNNPNQSVYAVATPAQIKANKTIFLNKDGSPRTVGQVYDILGNKINKKGNYTSTPTQGEAPSNYINPTFSNLPATTESVNLANEQEATQEAEDKRQEVAAAKNELNQKQAEENFVNDFFRTNEQQRLASAPQQSTSVPPQQNQDIFDIYGQVSQYVETPLLQQGGNVPISSQGVFASGDMPVVVPAPNITMKNVTYPIQATSLETGETRLLQPNEDYFFKGTKNVLEIPQLQNYFNK